MVQSLTSVQNVAGYYVRVIFSFGRVPSLETKKWHPYEDPHVN
jgi:hypothetical protein